MSNFGICNLSIVPLRLSHSHKAEMVSQLLFGEIFEIKEMNEDWYYIKVIHDDYLGWVHCTQILRISDSTYQKIETINSLHTTELVQLIYNHQQKRFIPLVIGSTIPYLNDNTFYIDDFQYTFDGDVSSATNHGVDKIIETAQMYMNAPYLWGGRTPFGIDCSGFIQMVFKTNGINLKRDAHQQASMGETLSFISDAHAGDVAFFDDEQGQIIHTGLIIGKNKIMHASGSVRIDTIDHFGIFNYQENKYTHKLRLIKRFIND